MTLYERMESWRGWSHGKDGVIDLSTRVPGFATGGSSRFSDMEEECGILLYQGYPSLINNTRLSPHIQDREAGCLK